MSVQAIAPELRQWIIEQAKAGCQPEAVLQAMRTSGWDEDTAAVALEQTLSQFLAERAQQAALPPPVRVPDVDLTRAPSVVSAGDREVRVLMTMRNPRIVVLGGLLSDEECEELMAAAGPRMTRSETVVNATGGSEVHSSRTSRGMFFGRGEIAVCQRVEQRIAALLQWPVINGEGLQVLHYGPGAE